MAGFGISTAFSNKKKLFHSVIVIHLLVLPVLLILSFVHLTHRSVLSSNLCLDTHFLVHLYQNDENLKKKYSFAFRIRQK